MSSSRVQVHTMEFVARSYQDGKAKQVKIVEGTIAEILDCDVATDMWFAPGMCDLQINGAQGIAFNNSHLQAEDVATITSVCRAHGMTQYCPTLITDSQETVSQALKAVVIARESLDSLKHAIAGIHLEGPYISPEDGPRGAHPKIHVRDPDWDEFQSWQDDAQGLIKLVTLAPERPGAIEFIEKLSNSGVRVAIGHTSATPEQIRTAVAAGASISTHLGNGCHAVISRHDNYLWAQLADDSLTASMIADGDHLPVDVMKVILRCKTPQRLFLTCDASPLAGLAPGRYSIWGTEYEIDQNRKITVPGTPYLAGSGHFLDHCLTVLLNRVGVTVRDVIDMSAILPRQILGISVPEIEVGKPAELFLFKWQPNAPLIVTRVIP
jgi:N-acetylglucosamine-6-phosphate deacetylase